MTAKTVTIKLTLDECRALWAAATLGMQEYDGETGISNMPREYIGAGRRPLVSDGINLLSAVIFSADSLVGFNLGPPRRKRRAKKVKR